MTVLIAIDLNVAFDTVDHNILIDVLHRQYGVNGTVFAWVDCNCDLVVVASVLTRLNQLHDRWKVVCLRAAFSFLGFTIHMWEPYLTPSHNHICLRLR